MAKCIRNIHTGLITRVADDVAAKAVTDGTHEYCPKQEWKAQARASHAEKKTKGKKSQCA